MSKLIPTFNGLNGNTVTRTALENLQKQAIKEGHNEISSRIAMLLVQHPDAQNFEIVIEKPIRQAKGLGAARHSGLEKDGLDDCGRLKKGYKYGFDGKIQKVEPKQPKSEQKKEPKKYGKKTKRVQKPKKEIPVIPLKKRANKSTKVNQRTFEKVSFAPEEWKEADVRKTTSLLKKYLKEKYGINVKAKSDSFSMGSSLHIDYEFGPHSDVIEKEVDRLQYGRFDGMTDMYENHDKSMVGLILDGYILNDYKYVSVKRTIPESFRIKMGILLSKVFRLSGVPDFDGTKDGFHSAFPERVGNAWTWSQIVYQELEGKNLNFATQNESEIKDLKIHESDDYWKDGRFYFTYTVNGTEYDTRKPLVNKTKMVKEKTIVKNQIKMFDYDKNVIAVIGELGEIADELIFLHAEEYDRIEHDGKIHRGYLLHKRYENEVTNLLIDYSKEDTGLNASVPNPTVESTLLYAKNELIGKAIYHHDIGKKIHFSAAGIKKAIQGKTKPTRTRLLLVFQAKNLVKKARLYKTETDKKNRSEIKFYHTLRTTTLIDGKRFEVIIKIQERSNGALYYDHTGVVLKKKQISVPVDKSEPLNRANLLSSHKELNKDSKKGLNSPNIEAEAIDVVYIESHNTEILPVAISEFETKNQGSIAVQSHEQPPVLPVKNVIPVTTSNPAQVISEIAPKHKTLRYLMANEEVNELYQIPGDVGAFLGDVEIKPKESVVITLSSPQGGGKTRTLLQFANSYAYNYRVKIFSLEEHVESKVFKDKITEYIDPANFERISVDSELPKGIDTIHEAVKDFDIIMTDSWQKLLEIISGLSLDQDFRKKYDGKTFLFIYQQTADGKMRGGSTSQFDADIVLFVEKFPDYRKSYVYPNKNRYTKIPLDQLKYNIYSGKMNRIDEEFETETIIQ